MKKLENLEFDGHVIPTGPTSWEDRTRCYSALKFKRQINSKAPFIGSGIGPELNSWLKEGEPLETELNVHWALYSDLCFIAKAEEQVFGIDTLSVDTEGNMHNTFHKNLTGRYSMHSFPGHLVRMKSIELEMRERGELSEGLEIYYVPTKPFLNQSLGEHWHGVRGVFHRIKIKLRKPFT